MWRSPGKISDLSVCWNHWDNTHPLILWNREWLLGTPYTSKSHTVEQCHLSRQCTCPQRASWMYSWAPWEPSEVSEDCAGGYMNKFPNKTRQLWPTCELQNWNQVGSRVQIAPKWTPDRHAFTVGCVDVWVRFSWHNGLLATRILKNETDSFFSSLAVEPLGQKHLASKMLSVTALLLYCRYFLKSLQPVLWFEKCGASYLGNHKFAMKYILVEDKKIKLPSCNTNCKVNPESALLFTVFTWRL